MFNKKRIEALEKRLSDVEAQMNVGTGDFDERPGEVWGMPFVERTEKQIDIRRAFSALLNHLGVKIVVIDEKTETTPESVTLEPINKPATKRKK
jgi:hypothetical protein